MSEIVTVHGSSLKNSHGKERTAELHHLRIYANATGDGWVVSHHSREDDDKPKEHEFRDGDEFMEHIAQHANVPKSAHSPNDDLGRKATPGPEKSLICRGGGADG